MLLDPRTSSSAICGNIMVSLRKSSQIEVLFIVEFTQQLHWLLGIKLAATTAYHPQGDRHMEQVNQELE